MKKVNNLVVLGTIIAAGVVTYKVTYKVLGKLMPKKEIDKNNFKFDKYKIIKLQRKIKRQKIFNILCIMALILFIIK